MSSRTHSVSAMMVLTEIKVLETGSFSCVDKLSREPSHSAINCLVVLFKCCSSTTTGEAFHIYLANILVWLSTDNDGFVLVYVQLLNWFPELTS